MSFMRLTAGVALSALIAGSAIGQSAPAPTPGQSAGTLDPTAESTATRAAPEVPFQLTEGVIASVNDDIITGFELRQRMLLLIAMTQVQPTEENLPALQNQALQSLIDERLQTAEITKFEVPVSEEEVSQEIAAMAEESGTTAANYLTFLARAGIRPETLRTQIKVQMGWQRLVGGRFNTRSRVSRSAVEEAMRQLSESAAKPQYLVGEIYIDAARVGGQQAALNGAEQLVQQMIAGAPFQAVARQFSAAPSAPRGGDAGWIVQGAVQPALQAAMDQLQAGQLSRPIPVEGGVYILYMRDKRDGASTSLVSLKQIMVQAPQSASDADVAVATQRLEGIRSQLTCDNIVQRASSEQGLLASDLGESDIANLAPQFQQVARSAEIGAISAPVRTPLGVHLLAVCGRRVGGPEAPTYQQVQARLQNEQMTMLERRYMRDLRADSLIEQK